eukprot:2634116-Prymnesium_polylepis.1
MLHAHRTPTTTPQRVRTPDNRKLRPKRVRHARRPRGITSTSWRCACAGRLHSALLSETQVPSTSARC